MPVPRCSSTLRGRWRADERALATASRPKPWYALAGVLGSVLLLAPALADEHPREGNVSAPAPTITSATWSSSRGRLRVTGTTSPRTRVTLVNAFDPTQQLGSTTASSDADYSISRKHPNPVPCRVRVIAADGRFVEQAVTAAPANCAPTGTGNVAPTAVVNGPYTGIAGQPLAFSSAGSADVDGRITAWSWDFGDGTGSGLAAPTHTYASAGHYTVTLQVIDDRGTRSAPATTSATVTAAADCDAPIAAHCEITDYTGPAVCVACHERQARDMHGSVHYQQGGAFPNITNIPVEFAAAGERPARAAGDLVATGINTYCGAHENSPRFTCAGCHVGNGRFPMAQADFLRLAPDSAEAHAQLANIDCLTCHQEVYKRYPDWRAGTAAFSPLTLLNLALSPDGALLRQDGASLTLTGLAGIPRVSAAGDFEFRPAGLDSLPTGATITPMPLTTLAAARNVHRTTRLACLNCHARAGGADGTKRGDLAMALANPPVSLDLHMSPAGADLTCADCHRATGADGAGHRVRGRGLDLRANDVPERFTCAAAGCHSERPHGDYSATAGASRDRHAMKVACQTCHIPSYAKAAVGTEVARDWQDPHPSASACNGRGGWLPREDKGGLGSTALTPDYQWFDGTSRVAWLGESLADVPTVPLDATVAASFVGEFQAGDPAPVLAQPNGDVTSPGAKLYPMKVHWGKLARDQASNSLIAHSTYEFFRTGSFCRAVAVGLGLEPADAPASSVCGGLPGDTEMPPGTSVVPVFTWQTINHGVAPKEQALGGEQTGCGSCHRRLTGGPARLDLPRLGYGPRTLPSVVVGTRVTALNGNLDRICSQCHENKTSASERAFAAVHQRHVTDKRRDCAACHDFSRPERGLNLSRK